VYFFLHKIVIICKQLFRVLRKFTTTDTELARLLHYTATALLAG